MMRQAAVLLACSAVLARAAPGGLRAAEPDCTCGGGGRTSGFASAQRWKCHTLGRGGGGDGEVPRCLPGNGGQDGQRVLRAVSEQGDLQSLGQSHRRLSPEAQEECGEEGGVLAPGSLHLSVGGAAQGSVPTLAR